MVEPHHVAGIERQPRRRQPEGRGLAADPLLEQRPAAAALGVAGGRGDGEGLRGHAQRRAGRAARLDAHRVVLLVGAHQLPLQRLRQLGLLRPHQLEDLGVGVGAGDEIVEGERRHRPAVARLEADDALALDRVEAEVPRQRRDRGARAFERGDQIAVDDVGERRDVDLAVRQPGAAAELADEAAERDRAEPAVQPVAEPPVVGVGPDVAARREGRERPRVPGPGGGLGGGDHPAASRRSRSGCSPARPSSRAPPRGSAAARRRRASRGRSTAGSSRPTSGRRRRSAGSARGRPPGSRSR